MIVGGPNRGSARAVPSPSARRREDVAQRRGGGGGAAGARPGGDERRAPAGLDRDVVLLVHGASQRARRVDDRWLDARDERAIVVHLAVGDESEPSAEPRRVPDESLATVSPARWADVERAVASLETANASPTVARLLTTERDA